MACRVSGYGCRSARFKTNPRLPLHCYSPACQIWWKWLRRSVVTVDHNSQYVTCCLGFQHPRTFDILQSNASYSYLAITVALERFLISMKRAHRLIRKLRVERNCHDEGTRRLRSCKLPWGPF